LSEGEADLILMIHGAKTDKELQEE
jgi:hypothetical protein